MEMALPEILWLLIGEGISWLTWRLGGSLELCWHGSSGDLVAIPEIWWIIRVVLAWLFWRYGGSLELCWHGSSGDLVAHRSCVDMALPEIWWLIGVVLA